MIERVQPASHLRVAVPAYTGQVSVQTAHSIGAALGALTEAGVKVDVHYLAGCCYIDHTRNMMVHEFLASAATDLLFIDADVGFGLDAVLRSVMSDRPVIAGIYPKKGSPQAWPVAIDAPEIWSDRAGNIECAMVPTGFLRINRAVFEAMAPHVETYMHNDGEPTLKAFFKTEIDNGIFWGEDPNFCRKWRAIGGKVYAMAEVEFGHVGTYEWRGSWPPKAVKSMEKAA
jgi:hypothetical protein